MERLSRGVVAVRTSSSQVYVGWRLFGNEGSGTVVQPVPLQQWRLADVAERHAADVVDQLRRHLRATDASRTRTSCAPVVNGVEQSRQRRVHAAGQRADAAVPAKSRCRFPAGGTTPSGESYTYTANDLSVGDLDGDGELEYVLKWDPTNAKDNSQAGYTGNVFLDAYELNGTRLWRIDLGRNIRAGAHYTQFQVYDFDGDGRAEVMCKTADGTRSGTGQVIGNCERRPSQFRAATSSRARSS